MYFYHSMEFRIFVEENRKISLFDMNKKDSCIFMKWVCKSTSTYPKVSTPACLLKKWDFYLV